MPKKESVLEGAMKETVAAGAKPDNEQMDKPDFDRALRVLRGDIKPAMEGMAETRGGVSAAWKVIADECHVHKAAARFFQTHVMAASTDKREDVLRSLFGLCQAAEIQVEVDLVDMSGAPAAPAIKPPETPAGQPEPMFH
ncbi:hypothetical protein [Sandarakinorhabdus sp. DWP1-3-1]|uniref:hypothetical protein n=1 Tax=Sandarakinorhabdus sp. DWP1-3-1 TaxID=2804627 RepID=UPI003CEE7E52